MCTQVQGQPRPVAQPRFQPAQPCHTQYSKNGWEPPETRRVEPGSALRVPFRTSPRLTAVAANPSLRPCVCLCLIPSSKAHRNHSSRGKPPSTLSPQGAARGPTSWRRAETAGVLAFWVVCGPQKASGPPSPRDKPLPAHRPPFRHLTCRDGRMGVAPRFDVDEPCVLSPDRATKTSPRRPRRWLTRSPTPPWRSTCPREPSTSSSLASERRGPGAPTSRASVPRPCVFPRQREPHLLQITALPGNVRQSNAPSLCPTFPHRSPETGPKPCSQGPRGFMQWPRHWGTPSPE